MEAAGVENAARLAATSKVMAAGLDLPEMLRNEFMFVLWVNCAATSRRPNVDYGRNSSLSNGDQS